MSLDGVSIVSPRSVNESVPVLMALRALLQDYMDHMHTHVAAHAEGGDWSRSSPGPHPTAAVYPYNSFWRRNFTSSPSENSTYPYTDWPTGTDEPERNFNTETTQATASKTNNTTDYDGPQSDRVLVEMPGSLATDQDLHFVMSLVPMLRQRSLRDKLDLQVEVLNLFRSKVSYD
ncbi:hypothetical protein MSG28_011811 [Choristoneura fumiferana]|uniref:Uncharacterized protein n=1 Tax=Choristoneura fumiferana TaxID=7141 RepID=A0ACC0KLT8_CHOFU|nr:hypothetical protein MSG28_011811 [Choristoneura fumiferana]